MAGKRGRPSGCTDTIVAQAEALARLGLTDAQMAEVWDVTEQTVNNWKQASPEFFEALKAGKALSDMEVSESLYRRATGFVATEQQAFKIKTVQYDAGKRVSEVERIEVVDVTKEVPPDTTAAIFWLKNRRPAEWRDKTETHHTVSFEDALSALDEPQP